MTYHLHPALARLVSEADALWPNRDRSSDGWIGDRAHAARKSDHNPDAFGSVNAYDFDVDGIDTAALIAAAEAHPATSYWIFDSRLAHRSTGFRQVPYTGSNPHRSHLHISARPGAGLHLGWLLPALVAATSSLATTTPQEENVNARVIQHNGSQALVGPGVAFRLLHTTTETEALLSAGVATGPVINYGGDGLVWNTLTRLAERAGTYTA